jgi:hypothetical protein
MAQGLFKKVLKEISEQRSQAHREKVNKKKDADRLQRKLKQT